MIAFDTLSAATRLRQEAGFSEDQARVLVDTFAQCVDESLPTKRHVKETEVALSREMRRMDASLRGEIAGVRGDLEKTEASLRAEIAGVRGDLEKTEASLRAEIAGVRGDLKETEAALRGEITVLRGDLAKREGSLREDLEKMEASLRADMRALEHRMTIKLGGIVSAALGILVALEALVF